MKDIKFIARTAVMLALTVAFQMLGRMIPGQAGNFVAGPLVNACILVSTAMLGLKGGLIICAVSPFTSLINNHAAIAVVLLPFSVFIAAGNMVLASLFHVLKNVNKVAGIIAGAVLKAAFLYASALFFLKLFPAYENYRKQLVTMFSLPQLITAIIGGAIAYIVIKKLDKHNAGQS